MRPWGWALAKKGLDIVTPLRLQWYNDIAPESAPITPGTGDTFGPNALVVLVGNSRELWPRFLAAHSADPSIADAKAGPYTRPLTSST
jgi:hypothetical protein